jgi:hypothetical protein
MSQYSHRESIFLEGFEPPLIKIHSIVTSPKPKPQHSYQQIQQINQLKISFKNFPKKFIENSTSKNFSFTWMKFENFVTLIFQYFLSQKNSKWKIVFSIIKNKTSVSQFSKRLFLSNFSILKNLYKWEKKARRKLVT